MLSKSLCVALVGFFSIQRAHAAPSARPLAARQGGDPQTSLTLDPAVIATGFANDGQNPPVAGQVPSLTSTNNFINFCLTVPNLPITNGKQITTGSCNPAPIGVIPSVDNMPSSKFIFPPNLGAVKVNTAFTIQMAISNLETGNFVNAQANYYAAPQILNAGGTIRGHSHVVIEKIDSFTQSTPTNPKVFAFFKGLNGQAQGGILTTDVTAGLPEGTYRLSSINTAMNHQPAIVPVAQRGALDDAIYFSVTQDGQPPAGAGGSADPAPAPEPAPAPAPAPEPAPASGSSTTAPAGQSTTTTDPAGQSTTTSASSAAQATATGGQRLNFGRCPAPSVSFGTLRGRQGTFYRADNAGSFPVNPAKQIETVVDAICQRLSTTCRANNAAQQKCRTAATAAKSAPKTTGEGADVFNAAFGKTTTFKNIAAK